MTKKTLKDFLEVYKPKSPDEQKFVDKHVVIKHKDRNGNGDDVFKATNIKTVERKKERHGYDVGEDEKVYEELKGDQHKIDANKNGKVDAHDFHLLRKKKKVAEEVEELDELSQKMVRAYRDKARDDKESAEDDREYYKSHDDNTDDEDKKIRKRSAGIKMAGKKIYGGAKVPVKEEVDIDAVLEEALDLLMSIDEKTLTPAEMKKREEVVKAIKRGNPKMDKSMAYAIATKTAKRVAEGKIPTADEPDYDSEKTADKVRRMLAKEKKPVKEEAEEIDEGIATYDKKGKLVGNYPDLETAKKLKPGHHYAPKGTVLAALDRVGKPVWAPTFKEEAELEESAKVAAHLIKRYGDNVRKSHVRSAANDFGVGYVALSHAVRKKLGVNRLEEEQIDEISAKKLTDYTAKASDARGHRDMSTAKLDKRYKSMALAHEKIRGRHAKVGATNEEAEQIDELSKKALRSYTTKAVDSLAHNARVAGTLERGVTTYQRRADALKQAEKRRIGINRATSKLTKEDAEQIDELSKKTLGNYTYKAASELGSKGITTGLKIAADEPTEKNFKKMANRQKGVATAVKKLTKEDIINRSIDKYVPEDVKFTPEERLLKRLDGLSEAHVNTLLGLFEALNKDNQNKMIETVETREGINQLLNFALENRGE